MQSLDGTETELESGAASRRSSRESRAAAESPGRSRRRSQRNEVSWSTSNQKFQLRLRSDDEFFVFVLRANPSTLFHRKIVNTS